MVGTNGEVKSVQVKLISKDMVKPSSPTPSNLQTLKLSCIDQLVPIFPPRLMPVILFYTASPESQPVDIAGLKTSLSRALTIFYPLAGRAKQSTITCNDEGIPFIETQVDCPLSDVLYSAPKPEVLSKLLPPPESLGTVENKPSEVINISIQINVFTCGGVVIAWYDIHKINDGVSSTNFFKHWAAIASQREDDPSLITPNFDIAPRTFPQVPNAEPLSFGNMEQSMKQQCSVVVKSFRFSNTAINKLKPKAATNRVLNPSRFVTVTGFIWEQILAAKTSPASPLSGNNDQKTALILSMDMRPRLTPPLPQGTMGNLFSAQVISADLGARLPDLVAEINDAVGKNKDEIKGYGCENGVNPMRENWRKLWGTIMEYKDTAYTLTSWCKIGFNGLDFGFGKPKWVIPTDGKIHSHSRNFIQLMDYSDSNEEGIEAWLFLEEKEMETLVSNAEFLTYASPVF